MRDQFPGRLFVVPLSSPVTFDSRCTLPACVPNDLITVDDLDLSDCRVVASGTYNDSDPASEWCSFCAHFNLTVQTPPVSGVQFVLILT